MYRVKLVTAEKNPLPVLYIQNHEVKIWFCMKKIYNAKMFIYIAEIEKCGGERTVKHLHWKQAWLSENMQKHESKCDVL